MTQSSDRQLFVECLFFYGLFLRFGKVRVNLVLDADLLGCDFFLSLLFETSQVAWLALNLESPFLHVSNTEVSDLCHHA